MGNRLRATTFAAIATFASAIGLSPTLPGFRPFSQPLVEKDSGAQSVTKQDLFFHILRRDLPELPFNCTENKNNACLIPSLSRDLPHLPGYFSRVRTHYLKAAHMTAISGSDDYCCEEKESVLEANPTKSYDVFSRLPYNEIIERLKLNERESIQILYPGGGVHLASLEIGFRLQQKLPHLKNLRYIFTEVSHKGQPAWPEAHFETLVSQMGNGISIEGKSQTLFGNDPKKRETLYELSAFGRKIEVAYVIGLSEKGDHPFFKKKYVVGSDVILFHDAFLATGIGVITAATMATESKNKYVIIFENYGYMESSKRKRDCTGEMVAIKGEYGCSHVRSSGAIVFFPDISKWSKIKKRKRIGCQSIIWSITDFALKDSLEEFF